MKKINFLLLLLVMATSVLGQKRVDYQTSNGVKKYFGIDKNQLTPKEWKAHWIWRKGQTEPSNVMLSARKTFELTEKPDSSRLYITGDSHYTLYVNGEFISRGPARSVAHHQSYDIIDIASRLKTGKNVLAIRVHHSGNTVTFIDKVRPGLLFQLELHSKNNSVTIVSDQHTKVQNEEGWDTGTAQVDGSNMAMVENVDLRKSSMGWEKPDFNDSKWENAILIKQAWWPPREDNEEDFARMSPWHTLVPRDIPYLEEQLKTPRKVFETGECAEFSLAGRGELQHVPILGVVQHQVLPLKYCKVNNLQEFIAQKGDLNIENFVPKTLYDNEPFRNTWIVFDFGEILLGYPTIEVEATKGTNLDITYAANLIDGKYNPAILADDWGDRVILPGGKIKWEAQELKTFRYLGFYISNTQRPVTISYAGVKQTYYPFNSNPPQKLSDEMLEKLSAASNKTLKIVTHDAYTDNYRERRQYIQTAWYSARGNYHLFGDPYLMRRCLVQIADDQLPNGFLPMHAPGKPKAGILEADFFWHMGLYDYYLFTGDATTVRNLLVPLKRNIDALEDLEDKDGVLNSPPHPHWIDHTGLDRRGISFTLNGWYALALDNDAILFKLLGDAEAAKRCQDKADKIKRYLKTNFWNADKGLFAEAIVDGKQTSSFDEISNGVALILKITDKEQTVSIAEKLKTNDETQIMVRPTIMMYWPVEGLFAAGYRDEALQILKSRYKVMMQHEEGTLWEGWNLYTFNQNGRVIPKTRSAAQAEQVFHPDIFTRHLLGYEIIKPGAEEVRISYKGYSKNMSGTVPTAKGNITINWVLEGNNKKLELSSPQSVKLVLDKSSFPKGLKVDLKKY